MQYTCAYMQKIIRIICFVNTQSSYDSIHKMAKATPAEFIDWLNDHLAQRGWSDNQLGQQAGINASTISRARSGIAPGYEACEKIATAFGVPAEMVFRLAGLLPKESKRSPTRDEWNAIINELNDDEIAEMLAVARPMREQKLKARKGIKR